MQEIKEKNVIDCYCKICRRFTGVSYRLSGDMEAPVLTNVQIKCHQKTCKRVMYLKKYTEKKFIEGAVGDKFYL